MSGGDVYNDFTLSKIKEEASVERLNAQKTPAGQLN